MRVHSVAVRPARLRRLITRKLIPSRRLEAKVTRLLDGRDVTFTVDEVADLRLAARLGGRPLLS